MEAKFTVVVSPCCADYPDEIRVECTGEDAESQVSYYDSYCPSCGQKPAVKIVDG